ncbi:MAG: transposase [Rhodoplanes sp.]
MTKPARVAAQHQSLLHFVGAGGWSDERVLAKVREMVLPAIERHGAISAWIIDDTSFPKQGQHSVGVARQYCGQLGKQDNCQVRGVAVASQSPCEPAGRLPAVFKWADDPARRRKAGVPEGLVFKTNPEIALEQLPLRLFRRTQEISRGRWRMISVRSDATRPAKANNSSSSCSMTPVFENGSLLSEPCPPQA